MNKSINITEGYKITKPGSIPNGWRFRKFDDCVEISNGQVDPTNDQYQNMILIAPNHIESETGRLLYTETVSQQDAISGKYLVKQGDLIYCKIRPYLNKIFFSPFDCLCSADMYALRSKTGLSQNFLFYQLKGRRFVDLVNRFSARTGIPKVNREDLKSIHLILPPLHEQQKIAEILSTWDQCISSTQKLIDKLKLRNKGLVQQLLTGKKRINGFEGGWREFKIGDVTEKFSKRNKHLIDARIYSITNYSGFVLQSDHFSRQLAGEDLTSYKIISRGEFAYNPARINVGSIAYFNQAERGVISSLYVCFRTKNLVLDSFIAYWIGLEKTIHDFGRFGEGGVRVYLWYELFATIKIRIPSIDEQIAIVSVLDKANEELKLYQKQLDILKEQKKGLMQKLLTGDIRVKTNSQ